MRKKYFILVFTLVFAMSLTACGNKTMDETNTNNVSNSATETLVLEKEPETNNMPSISEETELKEDNRIAQMQTATLQYPSKNDEWSYNVYSCYIELTDYRGSQVSSLTIPSEIENLPVWVINAHIGRDWKTPLTSVTIPDSILIIGDEAFRESALTTVNFSEGLISIGELAFYDCNLNNIELPNTLETIGDSAFWRSVPDYPIEEAIILEELVIPQSVITIGEQAFAECLVRSIVIPESVKSIGTDAFAYCNGITGYCDAEGKSLDDPRIAHDLDIYIYSTDVIIDGDIGGGTIHGYAGSTAAQYCAEYYNSFEVLR